jgi:hypothetical protein
MGLNSVLIRFEDLEDLQMQLLFEEETFAGFEKEAFEYCGWLLTLTKEQREVHHRSLSRMAHAVRTAHGRVVDIAPDCDCNMCAQWYWAAVRALREQAEAERLRRKEEKMAPKSKRPTFVYLMRDERSGFIKIGRAKDPDARERTLQSENPHVLMVLCHPADASIERELHHKYGDFRVRGEWFRLSIAQIEEIKMLLRTQPSPCE